MPTMQARKRWSRTSLAHWRLPPATEPSRDPTRREDSAVGKLLAIARGARTISGEDTLEALVARGLVVGRNFRLGQGSMIDYHHCWLIDIGDDVVTAPRVHIIAHDGTTKRAIGLTRIARVIIGDRVFLGAGVIVMPGVTIGDDSIIGAGSVVTKSVPPGVVAVGNPAHVLMTTDEYLARCREVAEGRPRFGPEYTLAGGITPAMREEMRQALADGQGYVS
jgi:maltose O-acetyltransferase